MATLSGQKTVAAPGTAERLTAGAVLNGPVIVKALPSNTSVVYVGNVSGDVDSANGLPLSAGEAVVFEFVGNASELWLDAAVGGEGVAWCSLRL